MLVVMRSLVFVPQGTAYILERLGQFERVLGPGLHVTLPFLHGVSGRSISESRRSMCRPHRAQPVTASAQVSKARSDSEWRIPNGRTQESRSSVPRSFNLQRLSGSGLSKKSDRSAAADAVRSATSQIRDQAAELGLALISASPFLKIGDEPVRQLETVTTRDRADGVASAGASPLVAAAQPETLRFAVASGTIAPGALGSVDVDGRQWTARNLSSAEIPRGFRCVVERQEGETLLVRCI